MHKPTNMAQDKNTKETKPIMRTMDGEVITKSADKTVKVKVGRMKMHPIYKKRYMTHTKYLAHDEKNSCQVGDKVTIVQCRPMSKKKTWRVVYSTEK